MVRKKIIYCLESTGVAGGHKVVFDHLNLLSALGWEVELYAMSRPMWYRTNFPVTIVPSYSAMQTMLEKEKDAIIVATWWKTQKPVYESCKKSGSTPVYFVQDIETSYYGENDPIGTIVMQSYEKDMEYITTSDWNMKQLSDLSIQATKINPAIDHNVFKVDPVIVRQNRQLLALNRSHPLKNIGMTVAAWNRLGNKEYDYVMFGIDPKPASDMAKLVYNPTDKQVARIYSEATFLIQTSKHEGFCLPILEAMACGAVVITTDADGNADFCRDEVNCIIVDQGDDEMLAKKIEEWIEEPQKLDFLQAEGYETAKRFNFKRMGEELNNFYESLCQKK